MFDREEKVDYWLEVSGYDSNIIMFTLGLEFYVFFIMVGIIIGLRIAMRCLTA